MQSKETRETRAGMSPVPEEHLAMGSRAVPRHFGILALAPAPGLTLKAEFAAALMPSLGGVTLLRLQLFGFYGLADGQRYPCRTLQIDPNQLSLSCQVSGKPGDHVDLDLDLLGSLHGVIEGQMAAGLRVNVGDGYQDHIAQKLAWFKACLSPGADAAVDSIKARGARRIVPWQTTCRFVDPDGVLRTAMILNISCSGAALKSDCLPPVGAPIVLGGPDGRRGLTVRRFEGGFAMAFLESIPAEIFGPYMTI